MEEAILIILLLLVLVMGLPITALVIASRAKTLARETQAHAEQSRQALSRRIAELERLVCQANLQPAAPPARSSMAESAAPARPEPAAPPMPVVVAQPAEPELPATPAMPELPAVISSADRYDAQAVIDQARAQSAAAAPQPPYQPSAAEPPPPLPPRAASPSSVRPVMPPAQPSFGGSQSMEQFIGAKLLGWIGGLIGFLCVIYFIKHSIDNNLISPSTRTAMGFVTGLGLLFAGLRVHTDKALTVLGQTLCATGVLVLFGVTFAGSTFYHLYPPLAAFVIMVLITATAFLLAIRMQAQVVAILGMVGGFLTPVLCSTGHDNPGGLFGYIALLDSGLLMVARQTGWRYLGALGALGTLLMQWGWVLKFFDSGHYDEGALRFVPIAIFLGFAALFATAAWRSRVADGWDNWLAKSALWLSGSALLFGFVALEYVGYRYSPALLYGHLFLAGGIALSLSWAQPSQRWVQGVVLVVSAFHLSIWTIFKPEPAMLPWALGLYLVFGLGHTLHALLWQRRHPTEHGGTSLGWMPVITLLLMLLPVLSQEAVSFAIWPAMLLANAAVIGLAAFTRNTWPVVASLGLTLFAALSWMNGIDPGSTKMMLPFLLVVGGFAAVFAGAAFFLAKRLGFDAALSSSNPELSALAMLPVASAVLPFGLLMLATLHFKVADPSPIFGLALLLVVFLLGLAKLMQAQSFVPVAFGCVLALEATWHLNRFGSDLAPVADYADLALGWYLGFYALFTLYPLAFRSTFETRVLPWMTSALAGVGQFMLVYAVVKQAWPSHFMGLIPAAFILAPLATLLVVLKKHLPDNPARLDQLAWLGGAALLFITLIFPIQFSRQWLTLAWALEGAALCWLFLRVPHSGLRGTGFALLCVAFVRLVLNPAVLDSYQRSGMAILNWHLYTYGLAALACFAAARWLSPPRHQVGELNACAILWSLGGILTFVLLNLEIADYFTPEGARFVTIDLSANLARDMTYSIAWALFALALLMVGIAVKQRPARITALALLGLTFAKLFFHDLATLENIYRVGALLVVAIAALAASFLYQRFVGKEE